MEVTVVGAGVIGLTTALALEQRGHHVRIVAAATHDGTASITSSVAGAVWFPYRAGPAHKVTAWSARTRTWLEQLAPIREAGVDILTGYEVTNDLDPWWKDACSITRVAAPVTGAPGSWTFVAPRCEPAIFLPWLARQLRAEIEIRQVSDLQAEPGDVVINCTGLGAKPLLADPELQPIQGQVLVTEPGSVDLSVTITDDRDPEQIFYVIPRRDTLVVGGIARAWPSTEKPPIDDAITARIQQQARALGLGIGAVKAIATGLRPYRPHVRLERTGRVIHNYGHGGAGFTMAWGCAEDVLALL
ncbi:MAG TPA: FAD-dependent oxidoreductase [Kofleriaceae bacterium]